MARRLLGGRAGEPLKKVGALLITIEGCLFHFVDLWINSAILIIPIIV
jgi:hypothetical protein